MKNPDIVQALLYIFAAAALGGLLVWLLLRQQLKDWKTRFARQASLLEEKQDRLSLAEKKQAEAQQKLAEQDRQLDSLGEERMRWNAAEKVHAAEKRALNEWKAKADKVEAELRKTRAALTEQAAQSDLPEASGEWQARLEKAEQSRQELQNELTEAARREARWHAEIESMQAEIQRLQAKNSVQPQAQTLSEPDPQEEILKPKERDKESITLSRIRERARELNFERIGVATEEQRDDLKQIKGIGSFLEKKLNSIGIYTFAQLANFSGEDEDKVNEVIEFFPGRIRRDEWVSQAKALLKQNDNK